jgi:hypothetical protein
MAVEGMRFGDRALQDNAAAQRPFVTIATMRRGGRTPDSFRLKDASGRVIGVYPAEDGRDDLGALSRISGDVRDLCKESRPFAEAPAQSVSSSSRSPAMASELSNAT